LMMRAIGGWDGGAERPAANGSSGEQ
jgi:hypothetical protein